MQRSSVQISLARCSELTVLHNNFQFNPGYCSIVQSGEVKLRLRQSNPVKCGAVWCSPVLSTPLTCTPVRFNPVHSIQWSLCPQSIPSRPIPFSPFQLTTFRSSIVQVHISQQQSSLVQSSAGQSSQVSNNLMHCGPSSLVKCYSKKPTFKPNYVRFRQAFFNDTLVKVYLIT